MYAIEWLGGSDYLERTWGSHIPHRFPIPLGAGWSYEVSFPTIFSRNWMSWPRKKKDVSECDTDNIRVSMG